MQWWERGALWTFILLVCAGIGAFVASRSNLFPPEVRVGPSPSAESPSPTPEPETRWRITLTSRTDHRYHVGGSCTSDWRMRARLSVAGSGLVSGRGVARLLPGARCDFPSAQVQSTSISIRIVGARSGGRLDLRLRAGSAEPRGSRDLGGFVRTLGSMRPSIREREGARAHGPTRVEEAGDEIFVAAWTLVLVR
jgi:hypothetical protein